ncbi:MAG: helix-turn-helix transcriptional regulator [Terriglobia bacterium]|jgi:transcriptional regulator with XRE-family HTH domain
MAEDIRIRVGRRLRKLRKQRGWTQVQMAEQFGLDRSYLADVEHGKRNISIVNLEVIARGFGLTLSRFLTKV